MNKGFIVLLNSFQLVNRNVNPVILKNGDGKNSLFVIQGTMIFTHSSHREKKVSPFAASPLMGKFSFTIPAKPFMGKRGYAFCDERGNLPIPNSLQMRNNISM